MRAAAFVMVVTNAFECGGRWLRTVPPEDVVIIVDAHDVLFFPCQRDVVEEYRKVS